MSEITKIVNGKRFRKIRSFTKASTARDYVTQVPHAYFRVIKQWNSNKRITEYVLYVR